MFSDTRVRWIVASTVVFNAAMWVGVFVLLPHNGAVLPLHYTIYFGINLTGNWWQMLWLPGIGTGAFIVHMFIAQAQQHMTWRRLWLVLALALNILLLIDVLVAVLYIRTSNF